MKIFYYFFALVCFFANNAIAQDENNIKINPPKPIIENEIKEVKLWGLYEELPNLELLPTDLWLNANFSNLEYSMLKLNKPSEFLPIENLVKRVIFSGGIAPNDDEKLAQMRFFQAHNHGPFLQANSLIANYPNLIEEENLAIIYAENLFYEEKIEQACETISALKPKSPKRKLLELRASCFALHNEIDAARLSLEVASSLDPKPIDDWLARAIQYVAMIKDGNLPNISRNFEFNGQNGINYILSKTAKADIKKGEIFSYSAMQALISNKEILGKNAAISALKLGLYDYENLQLALPFEPIKPPSPLNNDGIKIEPIIIENDIGDNVLFYLQKARNINEFANIAKTIAPKLGEIKQINIDNVRFFAAAAILNGQKELASRFLAMDFAQKPAFDLAFAMIDDFPKEFAITRRIDATKSKSQEQANAFGDAIIAKEIIEKNTNLNNLFEAIAPNYAPYNLQILYSIEKASSKNAIAEVILLSSLLTQNANIKNIDPILLANIIRAYDKINLKNEAKELAIFAIIGRNLDFVELKPEIKTQLQPAPKPNPIKPKPPISAPKSYPEWKPNVD